MQPEHYYKMRDAVLGAAAWAEARGIALDDETLAGIAAVKARARRRDRREPGRREKEAFEEKLSALVRKRFRRQAAKVRERLEMYYPNRKAVAPPIPIDDLFDEEDDWMAELIRLLQSAARHGVALFAEGSVMQIEWSLVNARAAAWAARYAYELVRGIDQTTRTVLQNALSQFVEVPGFTVGDVVRMLPFDEQRALMVATTEITRVYAGANQEAGEALAKEFPGVRVIKRWATNVDDRVCDICGPLDGAEADIDGQFEGGLDNPPAHPRCRCWTTTTTRITDG